MNIGEAIAATTLQQPFITREVWAEKIKIHPTNTWDCCVLYGPNTPTGTRCWNPKKEDLTADDWEATH